MGGTGFWPTPTSFGVVFSAGMALLDIASLKKGRRKGKAACLNAWGVSNTTDYVDNSNDPYEANSWKDVGLENSKQANNLFPWLEQIWTLSGLLWWLLPQNSQSFRRMCQKCFAASPFSSVALGFYSWFSWILQGAHNDTEPAVFTSAFRNELKRLVSGWVWCLRFRTCFFQHPKRVVWSFLATQLEQKLLVVQVLCNSMEVDPKLLPNMPSFWWTLPLYVGFLSSLWIEAKIGCSLGKQVCH